MSCFTILEVSSDADERAIRRAYAGLLKIHHPEDEPEKFREIRAAYEMALRTARLRAKRVIQVEDPAEDNEGEEEAIEIPLETSETTTYPLDSTSFEIRNGDSDSMESPTGGTEFVSQESSIENSRSSLEEEAPVADDESADKKRIPSKKNEPLHGSLSIPLRVREAALVSETDKEILEAIRNSDALTSPDRLASDFLIALRPCLASYDSFAASALFREPALRSLEAKEKLFFSAFEELAAWAAKSPNASNPLLPQLESIFHWSADEIALTKKYSGAAQGLFELYYEKSRNERLRLAKADAFSALRPILLTHVGTFVVFSIALIVWRLFM